MTPLAQQTLRWERIRHVFFAWVEMLWQTAASVILLVAIRVFDAPYFHKSLVPASGPLGLILTPFTLVYLARSKARLSRTIAAIFVLSGLLLFLSGAWPGLTSFIVFSTLAHIVLMQTLPLCTQLYASNFATENRGGHVASFLVIGGAVSAASSAIVGYLLDIHVTWYTGIIMLAAGSCLACAFCLWKIPSEPMNSYHTGNAWSNLSLAWKDKLFGWMLSAWMLLGLGNLITVPLRTEVLANPAYGFDASNQQILIITGVIPLITRLLATRMFGRLFDHWNLIHLRVTLNILFMISTLLFFTTDSLMWMGVSMGLFGIALAGGKLTWSLWVTKLAPREKTSNYMSVHMLCTGLRGFAAPFVGFALIELLTRQQIGVLGGSLILLATLMFLPAGRAIERRTEEHA